MSRAHEFHRRIAAAVACPFCGAGVGVLCRTTRGRPSDSEGVPAQAAHSMRIGVFGRTVK